MTPLRAIRKKRRLTIYDVAQAVAVRPGTISKIERGMAGASTDLAARLVMFYGRAAISEEKILYPERFANKEAA